VKTISVIVPVLNEESSIGAALEAIRTAGVDEIIVVDGGSTDRSVEIARGYGGVVLTSSRGRAWQMNTGAAAARGDVLAFVHADTLVPPSFAHDIEAGLADNMSVGGRFDVKLDDDALAYRLLGRLISIACHAERHRRPVDFRPSPYFRASRRISRDADLRGRRLRAPAETPRTYRVSAILRRDFGAAMAPKWSAANRTQDVVDKVALSSRSP
jgi:glycosyltransferase involved in cell wall biosynthesis